MSVLESIKIELKGIAAILKQKNSYVPRYQRSYAWKKQNVKDFLLDISGAISLNSNEYFLGSVVISQREEDRPEIVDGQQRLATTCIVVAAIRDYFFNLATNDGSERAQMIFNEYLAKKDLDSLELIPKLHLNDSDHQFFLGRIIYDPNSPHRNIKATKPSHDRLIEAADAVREHMSMVTATSSEPAKTLIQWINFLENRVKVIVVRVPDESNAFTIFETLNDRGLALAVSDLMKNYLFFRAENRVTEVQHNWVQMIASIETAEDEQAVVNFIRYYWSSRNGLVREKDLFDRIKKHVTSKTEAVSLSEDLFGQSKIYSAMITCDDSYWADFAPSAKISMQTLNFFNVTQMRPLLLSILTNFEKEEVAKALRMLVSWSVRFLIVGGLGGGTLEEKYSNAAVRIYKKEISTAKQMADAMRQSVPNDVAFRVAFANATVAKNYLARYYLRTLEMVKDGNPEPEFVPNTANDIVTLEHILPEKPSSDWSYINPDDAKANYKRIGNMVLLQKSANNSIGNAGFAAKAELFKKSEFALTRAVGHSPSWGLAEIASRQAELAELALTAWPV